MSKLKLFNIIELVIIVLGAIGFILTVILVKEYKLYYIFQALIYIFFIGLPFLHFALATCKEALIKEFDFKSIELYLVLVLTVYGVLLLMLLYNLVTKKNFEKYYIWYYTGLVCGPIIAPILAYTLDKKKKQDPKIVKNK